MRRVTTLEQSACGVRESMLKKSDDGSLALSVAERIVPLDRARTSITLLVVLYHSVINYTHFGIGGDRMRWIGFDGVALFCDSFFMACMFLISGLFVHDSLARRGASNYLAGRAWRLGVPYLVSIFVIMPIAYYRYYHTELSFAGFYRHMVDVGPWSPGSSWFLLVLLAFDLIAALLWIAAPRAISSLGRRVAALAERPLTAFAAFLACSVLVYLPLHLSFGDSSWLTAGHYPLVIQTSRILLYTGYFLLGVVVGSAGLDRGLLAEGGGPAKHWGLWLTVALLLYAAIIALVYVHHSGLIELRKPPLWWQTAYGLVFALFCAAIDVHVAGNLPALRAIEGSAARCDAALGLRDLSVALHPADLAAIHHRPAAASGIREISDRIHRHIVGELDSNTAVAADSRGGADDLGCSTGSKWR